MTTHDRSPAGAPRRQSPLGALERLSPVLPLLAVPLLLALTSGAVGVAPSLPVLGVAVVGCAILAGRGGALPRPWLDLPLAAALGLVAGHLLLAPGAPRAHDTLTHLWGVWAVAREVAAGELLPVWVHGLGLGMPLLQFYGPGSLLMPVSLALAGASPASALSWSLAGLGALAAAAMYVACARWTGDRRAALVAAVAYAFAPYRLLDSHYRAALGECAGMALLPLVFLFSREAARHGGRRRLAVAAGAWGLLIVTHPLSALMAALGVVAWIAVDSSAHPGSGRSPLRGLARLAGSWMLGAALAGIFVVPMAVGLGRVEVARVARGAERQLFVAHGLEPRELWQRRLWSSLELSEPAGAAAAAKGAEMPFYFGIVLLSLVPLARRAPRGLLALLAVALALSLRPVAAALSLVAPPLAVLQFPWRFLGLATFAAAALAGHAAARLLAAWHGRRFAAFVPGALAALLVLDAAPYTGAAEWLPPYRGLVRMRWPGGQPGHPEGPFGYEPVAAPYPDRVAGYFLPPTEPGAEVSLFCCAYPEYVTPAVRRAFFPPRDPDVLKRAGVGLAGWETGQMVRLDPLPYASWSSAGASSEERPTRRAGGEIAVELDGRPGLVVVREQHDPGWQAWTRDGWRDASANRDGLLHAAVLAGQREARFRFARTGPRLVGTLLSAAALLGVLALATLPLPRRPRDTPGP